MTGEVERGGFVRSGEARPEGEAGKRESVTGAAGRPEAGKPEAAKREFSHHDYAVFARQTDAEIAGRCAVETFHASGPGGQGVNTADSAVRMRHLPTGIVVVSREERSQLLNRQTCVAKLRAEFAKRAQPPKKRRKTRVPHREKERRLKSKRSLGEKKALRRKVDVGGE